jgi:sterol 3beta-glucosyltransferase
VHGFADGISGIVTQPYEGGKEDGVWGFTKGLAKGSMGLVTKPGAGMVIPFISYIFCPMWLRHWT